MALIDAPFTPEQVHNLNEFQRYAGLHPFTCHSSEHGSLIATCKGWICRNAECDYEQKWAHDFMADGSALARQREFIASLDSRFATTPQEIER